MRPALALLPFLFLYLFATNVESRKDPGEYWKMVMKDHETSEDIQGLFQSKSEIQSKKNSKTQEQLVDGFKHKCDDPLATKTQVTMEKKVFAEDFEPRPNISAYGDDDIDSKEEKKFVEDFEPTPNISAYNEEDISATEEKKTVKNFEPRPNISAYNNEDKVDYKGEKLIVSNEFERRPSITKYND